MGKKFVWEYSILVFVILVGVYLRTFSQQDGLFLYPDFYFHESIVKQNVENGSISNINSLDSCYKGTVSHPVGFYIVPHFFEKYFGNIGYASIFYWIISIIMIYFLMKKMFGIEIAAYTVMMLSLIYGNIQRTEVLNYRGENVIMPFLIGSIFCLYMIHMSKKKRNYSILAGLFSALPLMFWNGGGIVIVISNFIIILTLLFYLFLNRLNREDLKNYGLVILSQFFIVVILYFAISFFEKGILFIKLYLMLSGFFAFVFLLLYFYLKWKFKKSALFYSFFGIIVVIVVLFDELIRKFFLYFKLDSSGKEIVIAELLKVTGQDIWVSYFVLPLFGAIGLVLLLKKVDIKFIHIFGLFLPSMLLLIYARRYLFLFSISLCVYSALGLKYVLEKKNYSLVLFVFLLIVIIQMQNIILGYLLLGLFISYFIVKIKNKTKYFILGVFALTLLFMNYETVQAFDQRENNFITPSLLEVVKSEVSKTSMESCVMTTWDIGSLINSEVERNTYLSSVGQNLERIEKLRDYWFSSGRPSFRIDGYFLTDVSFLLEEYYDGYFQEKYGVERFTMRLKVPDNEEVELMGTVGGKANLFFKGRQKINVNGHDVSNVKKVFFNDQIYYNNQGEGCLFVFGAKDAIYVLDEFCDSNLIRMLMLEDIPNGELVYSNAGARLYKFFDSRNLQVHDEFYYPIDKAIYSEKGIKLESDINLDKSGKIDMSDFVTDMDFSDMTISLWFYPTFNETNMIMGFNGERDFYFIQQKEGLSSRLMQGKKTEFSFKSSKNILKPGDLVNLLIKINDTITFYVNGDVVVGKKNGNYSEYEYENFLLGTVVRRGNWYMGSNLTYVSMDVFDRALSESEVFSVAAGVGLRSDKSIDFRRESR